MNMEVRADARSLTFEIPGRVRGQGRIRHKGSQHFMDAKTRSDRAMVAWFAKKAMGSRAPLEGPLQLVVSTFIQPPESWSKKKREAAKYVTGKPDCDNTLKLICDSMNGIVYGDDSQFAMVSLFRRYTLDREHVAVDVFRLSQDDISAKRSEPEPSTGKPCKRPKAA